MSATADPSFELAEIGESSSWFGCARDAQIDYTDFAVQPYQRISILPSHGEHMAVCDSGSTLRGYVDPPPGTSRIALDLGEVDHSVGRSVGGLSVRMLRNDVEVLLTPQAPVGTDAPPGFVREAPVDPALGVFWLEISYAGGIYEDGSPSGRSFIDNLRFE